MIATQKHLCFLLSIILLISCFTFTGCSGSTGEYGTDSVSDTLSAETDVITPLAYPLSRTTGSADFVLFKIGSADAMLVATENCNILIGTGEKDDTDADEILSYLQEQNIDTLDAVIMSNLENDCIGGYAVLASALTIKQVYEPFYNATGHRYTKFLRTVTASGAELVTIKEETEVTFDDVIFRFYPAENPVQYTTEDDMSMLLTVTHGENTLFFTSVIEEKRISAVMDTVDTECSVLLMPHHGIWFDKIGDFLDQYQPKYALITDSELHKVSYDVLSLLAEKNITYYRTADAAVGIKSNGKKLTFKQVY